MREYELRYPLRGLRPYKQERRNSEWLVECFNYRATEQGIEHYTPFTKLSTNHTPTWPFPLILNGNSISLIIGRDETGQRDEVFQIQDDLSLTFLHVIDWATSGKPSYYDLIDYGKYYILSTDIFALHLAPWGQIDSILSPTCPDFGTACDFNGQLVIGNILTAWHDCGESYVAWSDVGNLDFTIDATNSRGYMKIPVEGKVLRILKLANNLVIYSTKGTTVLSPTEEMPAFGITGFHKVSIANPQAVAGGLRGHVFVDSYGTLWEFGDGVKYVGYLSFLSKLDLCNVRVTYDPFNEDYYISDGVKCYLYNSFGLTEVWQLVSSIKLTPHCGIENCVIQSEDPYARFASYLDSYFWCRNYLKTDQIDFGLRGLKTIFTLEVGADCPEDKKMAIDYRFRKSDEFQATPWIPLNHQGCAVLISAGLDFRVALHEGFDHPVDEVVNIDYLTIRYKMTDLRTLRGVYAPPIRGQGMNYGN